MLSLRGAHAGGAAEAAAHAFPQLPLGPVLHILSLLPADQRLRCAEVCRGWRATAVLPALWRRLDLSASSGVAQPVSPALLRAAVARAGGALTAIDLTADAELELDDVLAALRASSALVEARLGSTYSVASVTALLAAAPQLRELHCGVACMPAESVALLQGWPPFAPLRLRELELALLGPHGELFPALALADARLQPGLASLRLSGADLRPPGRCDVLADAVVARCRLRHLFFLVCYFSPDATPALVRMLHRGALTSLEFHACDATLLDAAVTPVVRDTLCVNSTVTSLSLRHLYGDVVPVVLSLLGSLVGHRSLSTLNLERTMLLNNAGAALAALVAADAPALTELNVSGCGMGAAGLGPLCDALVNNSHLRKLDIGSNAAPAGFMRDRLLPTVRANTGLRKLEAGSRRILTSVDEIGAAQEAERIVAAR